MKPALYLLACIPGVLGHGLEKRGCIADNCARAVTGTVAGKEPAITSRQEDCSSFMRTTVTPAPFYTTITITQTHTFGVPQPAKHDAIAARQVTVVPSAVPSYAAWCSGTARYSSACSCWGITATITDAPTPTVTVTAFATTTTVGYPCAAQRCGEADYYRCRVGEDQMCICDYDRNGQGVCIEFRGCRRPLEPTCDSDADCAPGYACTSGCCPLWVCARIEPEEACIKSNIFDPYDPPLPEKGKP